MLVVVATPIGNLGDLSPRAVEGLATADLIACEDTRRTRILLDHYGIKPRTRLLSYREQTEGPAGRRILRSLQEGNTVALCSDGGYPGISDPGYRIVNLAREHEIPVTVIPGASAVEVALVASGLPTSSFTFKGFPPRKASAMRRFFDEEQAHPHTLIIYESPARVAKTLTIAHEILGDRLAAVCLELTKKFESVTRDYLGDLCRQFADRRVKGEVTIVIAGNNPKFVKATGTDQRDGAAAGDL